MMQKSNKDVNKKSKEDFMEVSSQLYANKMASNVAKLKLYFSESNAKIQILQLDTEVKLTRCRKQLHLSKSVKHLDIKIDENPDWKDYINKITYVLMRGNVIIAKFQNNVDKQYN